ncbi:hypothetical protein DGMP_06480 [Desulfomarina profundi]|uniref:Phage protein n=1 Tax=Desulfomarina profundi TaxID=2772557 RepID=A0A8D5FLP9_9BACT|nr:hypothetical protein [Desulfomarina profundi]BCL59955.1 hypothetical protein DGMP_06480 [Desulfomarina profundi]
MKNKITDLNNHLFEQIERLNDDDLTGDKLSEEIARGKAISGIAKDITANAKLELEARKIAWEWNREKGDLPKMLEAE